MNLIKKLCRKLRRRKREEPVTLRSMSNYYSKELIELGNKPIEFHRFEGVLTEPSATSECDDCISRQALIEAIEKKAKEPSIQKNASTVNGLLGAMNIAWDMPSVQPTSDWIPCSERLPSEEVHDVLCCNKYGDMIIGYLYADDEWETGYAAEEEGYVLGDCVAWQPLPVPYKGGMKNV